MPSALPGSLVIMARPAGGIRKISGSRGLGRVGSGVIKPLMNQVGRLLLDPIDPTREVKPRHVNRVGNIKYPVARISMLKYAYIYT